MKNILSILLLSSACLWAQVPPPPGSSPIPLPPAAPSAVLPPVPAAGVPAPAASAPAADNSVVAIAPSQGRINLSEAELNKLYGPDEINFKAATIDEFLTVYANIVNRTVLRPATLPAPAVTLRNQTALTKREAIQLFDAVLGINGIAIINVGDKFVKAVPVAQANQEGAPLDKGDASTLSEMGQYVTHVVQLKYTKPSEMLPVLQPFAKIPNSILPIEANSVLVIRDFAENVKRMLEMIAQVDVSVPAEFISEVIPIKYALAGDIASALNSLGGGSGGTSVGGGRTTGATGTRSSGSRGGIGGGLGGGMGGGGMGGGAGYNPSGATAPGMGGGLGAQGAPGTTFTDRLRQIITKASTPGGAAGAGDITIIGTNKIIADERTNALLVYATRQDMETIKDVISKLDVVLAQVLIESIILGVSGDSNLEYGVSAAQKPKNLGSDVRGAGVMANEKDFLGTGQSFLQNLVVSNASSAVPALGGLSYFGSVNEDWLVAVKALSTSGKAEVLQRPTIMTTHATPGQFFVGSTVPYVTSTYYGGYGGGYGGGPSSSYQQLRVGIQLTVTPFINPDGIVVMKIDQAIEDIDGYVKIDGNDVPKTASRTLSADVTVRDRDTIVLGGFLRSSGSKTRSGVPLLKDIPYLGVLFSSTSDTKDRRELLVLMRPTVLKTPELAAMGSRIERDRMTGVARFEKKLDKESAEFDKEMDKLDGIKPAKGQPAGVPSALSITDPQTEALRNAAQEKLNQIESQPPPADWTQPQPQAVPPAQPEIQPEAAAPKSAPKAKTPKDPFKSTQPMTDEELKAYGRLPESP